MTKEDLFKLYIKEREYEKEIFGEYKDNPSLNVCSFLIFLDNYLDKAKKYYVSKWEKDSYQIPQWLISTKELISQGSCPVNTYEELIKIFVLAGAALEAYTNINVDEWREEGIKEKWRI